MKMRKKVLRNILTFDVYRKENECDRSQRQRFEMECPSAAGRDMRARKAEYQAKRERRYAGEAAHRASSGSKDCQRTVAITVDPGRTTSNLLRRRRLNGMACGQVRGGISRGNGLTNRHRPPPPSSPTPHPHTPTHTMGFSNVQVLPMIYCKRTSERG